MPRSAALTVVLVAAACHRALPSALSLPEPSSPATRSETAPTTRAALAAFTVGRDPLVRRPRLPELATIGGIADASFLGPGVAALIEAEKGGAPRLQLVEDEARGTEITAWVRGTRYGLAERLIVEQGNEGPSALATLAPLLTRLRPDPIADTRSRHPLEALAPGRPLDETVRRMAQRWVLLGWLDGPDVPLAPVAAALRASPYDPLREGPVGRIVVARAEGREGPSADGLADLRRATALALQRAAADRHGEQGAWADARRAVAVELGADDPIAFLLDRAHGRLVDAAGRPEGAGGALLAATARRLRQGCPDTPCASLDRVETIGRAAAWHPALVAPARAWTVVALKDAVDTMQVGHGTVMFPTALVDLVDALLGTGAVPPTAGLLTRVTPDPTAWALVGAMVGDDRADTWEKVRIALGRHLEREARAALEVADPAWRPHLERIVTRAVP